MWGLRSPRALSPQSTSVQYVCRVVLSCFTLSWSMNYKNCASTYQQLPHSVVFCMIQGTVECIGCNTSEVHNNAPIILPVQPANMQENLNIQPSKKFGKRKVMIPPPPRLLFKGSRGCTKLKTQNICTVRALFRQVPHNATKTKKNEPTTTNHDCAHSHETSM